MDSWLINFVNGWFQRWLLEQQGLLAAGDNKAQMVTDMGFYFGNEFSRIWWTHEKINWGDPFKSIVDEAFATADVPSTNRDWLSVMQRELKSIESRD